MQRFSRFYYLSDFDPISSKDIAFGETIAAESRAEVVFLPSPSGLFSDCIATSRQREEMLSLALSSKEDKALSLDCSLLESADVASDLKKLKESQKGEACFLVSEDNLAILEKKGLRELFEKEEIRAFPVKSVNEATFEDGQISLPRLEEARNLVDPCLEPCIRAYIEKERLYYVDKLASFLKSEHRLLHSLSVGNLSYQIACSNKLENPINAYVAGVLHDLGKHCPKEEEKAMMEEFFNEYADFPSWTFHQFTGAYLARKEFGIHDEAVLEAIRSHATGKKDMSPLGKIIYSADKIDPLRGYDSSWMIDACKKDYEEGFLIVLKENRTYLTEKGYLVDNPLTKECFEMYLKD